MKNVSKVEKYNELMSTIFGCVNAFKQAYDDIGGSYINVEDVDLRIDNINNKEITIQFVTRRIPLELDRTFLEGIKNKLRLSKSLLQRKVVIYNDCIIVDSKSRFTDIRIEQTNKFSGDHTFLISPDDYTDFPSTEVLFGNHYLNESDQMFVKLFENKNRLGYEGCDESTYEKLKSKLDDITDYINLKIIKRKFDNKKLVTLITQEEINKLCTLFKIKKSPSVLTDVKIDWSYYYEGAYDELDYYDEDEITDDMIETITRDAMIHNEECLPMISFKIHNKWYTYYPEDWDYDFEVMPKSFVKKIISCIK